MRNLIFFLLFVFPFASQSQEFDTYFVNKTLRIDYIFSGNSEKQAIAVDQLNELPQWAGRKHNLSKSQLEGNGQIAMYNLQSGDCIYKNTFSTLFQEWITTDEAKVITKSFENVFLLPFPKEKVMVEISLRDRYGKYDTKMNHIVDPSDILIHKKGYKDITPYSIIHKGKENTKTINVAILAEGYKADEMDSFRKYAEETVQQILSYAPFDKYKDSFNFYLVESPSKESGLSVPRNGIWKNTAFNSHFDTFYSERYLTSSRVKDIHDVLAGIPYEHIIILANTDVYGGGGIFNSYTLTTTGHKNFRPVVVHEFGHSFAGLADEYFYESDALDNTYEHNIEPWEENISTLVNFDSKWKDMLLPQTPIPTNISDSTKYKIGVFEGAGYSAKGIYRPSVDCRMKTNTCKEFCPVCQRAIEHLILFYIQ